MGYLILHCWNYFFKKKNLGDLPQKNSGVRCQVSGVSKGGQKN
jgi:hypothetical protein